MITQIGHITLLVNDQDAALDFYVNKLNFQVVDDATMGDFRWLVVAPQGQQFGFALLKATSEEQKTLVGNQAFGFPFSVLITTDCKGDYETFKERGVKFFEEPTQHPWGLSADFEDLYGNVFHLVQP